MHWRANGLCARRGYVHRVGGGESSRGSNTNRRWHWRWHWHWQCVEEAAGTRQRANERGARSTVGAPCLAAGQGLSYYCYYHSSRAARTRNRQPSPPWTRCIHPHSHARTWPRAPSLPSSRIYCISLFLSRAPGGLVRPAAAGFACMPHIMAGPAVSPRHALHGAITKGVKALPRPHAIADRRLLGRPYALCSHGFVEPRLQRRPSNLLSASLSLHAHRHLVSSHRWSVSVSVCRSRARYERPNRRSPHPHWRWRWRWLWLCCTAPSCRYASAFLINPTMSARHTPTHTHTHIASPRRRRCRCPTAMHKSPFQRCLPG